MALDIDVENADVSEEEIYKVCKLSNNVTFRRLKGYVKLLNACSVSAIVFSSLKFTRGLEGLKNYSGPANRLVGTLFSGQQFSTPHVTLPPVLIGSESQLAWFNQNLDHSQKQAVEFALKQRELGVIHGPPGTGKVGNFFAQLLIYAHLYS